MAKRVLIVGGNGGGMSCAARLRRLDEAAEVVVFDRGPHFSYAQCGLPYVLGREVGAADKLLLQKPERLQQTNHFEVRTGTEAVGIDLAARRLTVRTVATGATAEERYDALVLATGAAAVEPDVPGWDRPGHFFLRTVPDVQAVERWLADRTAKTAVVVGGGYIGLEAAEQLVRRGLRVTLVQRGRQVLTQLAPELAALLHRELTANGVALRLDAEVERFDRSADAAASAVVLKGGEALPADVVVFGLGARPEVSLAKAAGLAVGDAGGIATDAGQRTSDPHVWAVGDAVEVVQVATGRRGLVPLAGPANRQGRVAADTIVGRRAVNPGSVGTAVVRVFGLTAAFTGADEGHLRDAGVRYEAVHVHAASHAGYYPGAKRIALKLLFDPGDGRLFGAQAVGADGADKRIDVLATAISGRLRVGQVAQLDLGYAPPVGSAKDPVNVAAMAAENVCGGLVRVAHWHEVAGATVLDVREADERAKGAIPGSLHVPHSELRRRLGELPRDRELVVHCGSGQRSYKACRLLTQTGFRCRNLSGGYTTWETATDHLPGGGGDA